MKKVAVLVENLFDEQELVYPYHRLREDFEVHLIGSKAGEVYTSKAGFSMKSTHSSKDANPDDYVGLFIPGGFSPDYMRRNGDTVEFVRRMNEQNKVIAAICHGPWMLASCCDIKGKDVTSFYSIKDDLIHAGANWIDAEVVESGNLLTGRNPMDLAALLKAFVARL